MIRSAMQAFVNMLMVIMTGTRFALELMPDHLQDFALCLLFGVLEKRRTTFSLPITLQVQQQSQVSKPFLTWESMIVALAMPSSLAVHQTSRALSVTHWHPS